jgi:hypothetical protein
LRIALIIAAVARVVVAELIEEYARFRYQLRATNSNCAADSAKP